MATLNKPVPGGDIGTWGTKINAALDALNAELTGTTATAAAAETTTGSQSKANAAQAAAIAASEAKVPRTGASAGWIATLKADGTIYFTQPAAGTVIPDATTNAKGVVQLAGDGGTTAGTAVQGNDARLAGVVHSTTVTAVVALTQAAYDALATKVATTLYVISG